MREIFLKGLLEAHQGRTHTPENLRWGACPLKNLEDPWNISSFQPFEDDSLTRRDPLDSCSGVTKCAVLNTQIMIQMKLSGLHHTGCKNKQIKWADCIPNRDIADTFEGVCRQLRGRDKRWKVCFEAQHETSLMALDHVPSLTHH